jgi:hypothetical protein
MANQQKRAELMQAFITESERGKLWHDYTQQMQLSLGVQKDKHDIRTDFIRLVLPEIAESPWIFSALRDEWNQLAVKMGMPEEVK